MAQEISATTPSLERNNTPTPKATSHHRLWIAGGVVFLLCLVGAMYSVAAPQAKGVGAWMQWPAQAKSGGSAAFWRHWGDGKAELSSYQATVDRYGEKRTAELVLIYVTETMDRRTWIKDDAAPKGQRVPVLKLNTSLKFHTGIYPYSILHSTFSPVSQWKQEPFTPAKMTLSAQEWCGHVFAGIWAGKGAYRHQIMSYFASEGEQTEHISVPQDILYEDGLLIQLRELDGAFAKGKDWKGKMVPGLWRTRKMHQALRPHDAEIKRSTAKRNGKAITRFVLTYPQMKFTQTFDVETAWPRRVLAWDNSDGEKIQLRITKRLPYWNLNSNSASRYRKAIGIQ